MEQAARSPAPRPGSTEQVAVKPTRHRQPQSSKPRRSLQGTVGTGVWPWAQAQGEPHAHLPTIPCHVLRRSSENAITINKASPPNSEQVTTGFPRVAVGLEGAGVVSPRLVHFRGPPSGKQDGLLIAAPGEPATT